MTFRKLCALCFTTTTLATAFVSSCSDSTDDCAKLNTCGGPSGGSAGTSDASGGRGGAGARGGSAGVGGSSGAMGTGGIAGSAGDGGTEGGTCDTMKGPAEEPCLRDEAYGVFVSVRNGNDTTGDGSRQKPFKTIARGMMVAKTPHKKVFTCADGGDYAETLRITSDLMGVEVFGGFRCGDWSYDMALKSVVRSADPIAVKLDGLAGGGRFEDLDIVAADATAAGASSIGVFVVSSQLVVFRRVKVKAGKGAAGQPGTTMGTRAETGARGNKGSDACASVSSGGNPPRTICGGQGTASFGGGGGDGATGAASGKPGENGQPEMSTPDGGMVWGKGGEGQTGSTWSCVTGNGAAGQDGQTGPGASSSGTLSPNGYTAANAAAGTDGKVGQGGGGGGGAKAPTTCGDAGGLTGASGGSGGGGGCPGKGGGAGQGGGASIAVASVSSSVILDTCELVSQSGGDGGRGGRGQQGGAAGAGGTRGTGSNSRDGCQGGDGGEGGAGGPGGGGAGGPSLGVAYTGAKPTRTGGTVLFAAAPAPGGGDGEGRTSGSGAGTAGLREAEHAF
jgi:hypothetical protein